MPDTEMNDESLPRLELVKNHTQKLEDDLKKLGLKIKHHENNLKFLNSQMNNIDDTISDLQVSLGKYHTSSSMKEKNNVSLVSTEQNTIEQILRQDKTAAGIICQIKDRHGLQASKLPWTKDVLGVVATLGTLTDDNLSRLFSEFLGLETMLAIVCKTYEGVKSLEKYDKEGIIDKSAGLHGIAPPIGRFLEGRFLVFCLENLRPYAGEFVAEDPQKKLALLNPRLPNGERPPGFLGFAVNMINVDDMHLSCLTANGHGLRETLFYSLFSHLQVYKTKAQMQLAMPCISDGALSLDGGMIKSGGLFSLGDRTDVEVRFPISPEVPSLPAFIIEIHEQIKFIGWKKERFVEDMQREESLLNNVKNLFSSKKHEFDQYISKVKLCLSQAAAIQVSTTEPKNSRLSSFIG